MLCRRHSGLTNACLIWFRSGLQGGETGCGPSDFDRVAHGIAFVATQIVHDSGIAGREFLRQNLVDEFQKPFAIDRTASIQEFCAHFQSQWNQVAEARNSHTQVFCSKIGCRRHMT